MVTLSDCSNDLESWPVFPILLLSGLALFVCPTVFSLLAMKRGSHARGVRTHVDPGVVGALTVLGAIGALFIPLLLG